ncbi:MAG: PspC domain-containing protein [Bacteroidales bacterium]|nr:PspC domain-containing protein [Bacteroidales bacterium]
MDKTIKINLGGSLFQIDEEAYKILRRYLQDINDRLKNTQGGAETIEDIELRIAEIFNSQGAGAAVISRENVEAMISIIGKPEDFDADGEPVSEQAARPRTAESKKLYRNPDDTILGGVCGGLAPFLNIESVWIRLAFVIFTFFFFVGPLVYIALWIALPSALSDAQKKEMYGRNDFRSSFSNTSQSAITGTQAKPEGSGAGHAINEILRAIGKVLFIFLRIILIITGIAFVIGGFIALVSYIMVFFLNYPGYFSTGSVGVKLFYLPDFLSYIVNPAVAPWLLVLLSIIIILPLLALIYWGVKMIFWFRAKDGIISLLALVFWVISLAAFSILLFNEGVGFAEMSGRVSEEVIEKAPRNLYISADKKAANLNFDKDITFDRDYTVFLNDASKEIHITTDFDINQSSDESLMISVRKRATGRSKSDAKRNAEALIYNYRISADTIFIDEYFSLPAGTKWSLHEVELDMFIPQGTIVHLDNTTREMFSRQHEIQGWKWEYSDDYEYEVTDSRDNIWIMTDEGLKNKAEIDRSE